VVLEELNQTSALPVVSCRGHLRRSYNAIYVLFTKQCGSENIEIFEMQAIDSW
jgi:hypothetical protein